MARELDLDASCSKGPRTRRGSSLTRRGVPTLILILDCRDLALLSDVEMISVGLDWGCWVELGTRRGTRFVLASRPRSMEPEVSQLVDIASTGPSRRMTDASGDVLQPEGVLGEPGDLEDHPPTAVEVRQVDLQTTQQARTGGVLGVAVPTLGRGNALALVTSTSALKSPARRFGEPSEIRSE